MNEISGRLYHFCGKYSTFLYRTYPPFPPSPFRYGGGEVVCLMHPNSKFLLLSFACSSLLSFFMEIFAWCSYVVWRRSCSPLGLFGGGIAHPSYIPEDTSSPLGSPSAFSVPMGWGETGFQGPGSFPSRSASIASGRRFQTEGRWTAGAPNEWGVGEGRTVLRRGGFSPLNIWEWRCARISDVISLYFFGCWRRGWPLFVPL